MFNKKEFKFISYSTRGECFSDDVIYKLKSTKLILILKLKTNQI